MAERGRQNPHIIGLTGSFGSGCTYIANNILRDKQGYRVLSLSKDVLKPLFKKETGKDPNTVARRELQAFGDKIRSREGSGFLAKQISVRILSNSDPNIKWVVDSIRNPQEVHILRDASRNFFLFGVYAEKDTRWNRTHSIYSDNKREFDEDDENDTGEDNLGYGQRVGDCFYEADVVISNKNNFVVIGNDNFNNFSGKISQYVELMQKPLTRRQPIRKDEVMMAMAYAVSQRSSCMRRKVGAMISDEEGNILSSGFNEVPMHETPCVKNFNKCQREYLRDQFFEKLKAEFPQIHDDQEKLKSFFRKEFKNLDYCRALHAEENAIVNLAKHGRSIALDRCTLYTTTYPCRMCANKIVNVGIKNVVYLEPYPDQAAKSILKSADVNNFFFEGVTFRAYFRLYGEER